MYCYYCEKNHPPGGVRYGIPHAVGICHDCGVGVCAEHGEKKAGQPLLCAACAKARQVADVGSSSRAA